MLSTAKVTRPDAERGIRTDSLRTLELPNQSASRIAHIALPPSLCQAGSFLYLHKQKYCKYFLFHMDASQAKTCTFHQYRVLIKVGVDENQWRLGCDVV
jgi:hypothetical protein